MTTRVEEALEADGAERVKLVSAMSARALQIFLDEYNCDDGIEAIRALIRNPECELAVALDAFWLTDPDFSSVPPAPSHDANYDSLVRELYDGILAGRFPVGQLTYDPMAAAVGKRVQRYLLQKRGVPPIFLDPVG